MVDEIEQCPDCDSLNVGKKFVAVVEGTEQYEYLCRDCGAEWEDGEW